MADPRLSVSFTGIGLQSASYLAGGAGAAAIAYSATAENGSSHVGKAVTLSADKTVALAADGEAVIGKLLRVESDGICQVQTHGYMTLPAGNGATLTLGKKIVGAADSGSKPGFIREVATGTAAELGVARGFTVDNDTATAILVNL